MAEPPNKKVRMDLTNGNEQAKDERCAEPYNSSQDMFAESTEESSDEESGQLKGQCHLGKIFDKL